MPDVGRNERQRRQCGRQYQHALLFALLSGRAFLHPDFSVEQMQRHCITQLKKQDMPEFLGWIFIRGRPKLDRWAGERGG